MNAVIYTRVSQDDGSARSVSEQERECREYCARQGWKVSQVLTDNDIGASRFSGKDRPAYRALKSSLQPGDILVTWEASRAQRDLAAFVELRDLCASIGVKWAYTGRIFDLTDGDDRFTTGLDALLAEKEAEQLRARILRTKRIAAADGRPSGRLLFGYRPVRDERTGRTLNWEPSSEAPLIQEAARRVLAGESLRSVAVWAHANGLPCDRPTALKRRLLTPAYAGLRVHQGKVVRQGTWEPLWSLEQHRQLVAVLNDPGRRNRGPGRSVRHLLTGIARCGIGGCGQGMQHKDTPSTRAKGMPPFYACPCGKVARRQDKLDALVVAVVFERLRSMDPALLVDSGGAEAEEARAEADRLRARLDDFTAEAAAGELSARALAVVEQRLLPQIAAAERRARPRFRSPLVGELAADPSLWESFSVADRREVVQSLVSVTVLPTAARGRAAFRPEDVQVEPV